MTHMTAPRIVLVGAQHPGNIGAAARAMRTMGLTELVLVAPRKWPDETAFQRAAGADALLSDAPVYAHLENAITDCTHVLGCTARSRAIGMPTVSPREAAELMRRCCLQEQKIAVVFGSERTGLTNAELELCHGAVFIPSEPTFSSLNLAAAVQIIAYEYRVRILEQSCEVTTGSEFAGVCDHATLEGLYSHLAEYLAEIDFHKGRRPETALRKLRRVFAKSRLTPSEVRLLRGVLSDSQRSISQRSAQ